MRRGFPLPKIPVSGRGRRVSILLVLAIFSVPLLFAARRTFFHADGSGYVEKLTRLPENKIDIGLVALNLAKEFHPDLDVPAYSRKIDDLAEKIRRQTGGSQAPEERIRVMNAVLYQQEGYV